MVDPKMNDFGPNDRLSGRDTMSVPSQRSPSRGGRRESSKRGYDPGLGPVEDEYGQKIGTALIDDYKPLH